MSSLKQLIYNALYKIATPGSHELVYDTPEESRDAFIALVMAELFPVEVAAPVAVPVEVAKVESPKKVKAASPKKTKKAKAESPKKAAVVEAKVESPKKAPVVEVAKVESPKKVKKVKAVSPKKAAVVEPAVVVPVVVAKTESPKKVKQTKEEKEAEKAKAKAAKEEEAAKVKAAKEEEKAKAKAAKASPKKAAKAKEEPKKAEVNLAKIDPTWRKLLKESDKDTAKEREPLLLAYMNAMSNSAFNGKSAKEHVAEFAASLAAPAAPAAVELVDASLEVVEFQGKEYYVNTETKRVYEGELAADGSLNVTRPVGYVGMADFKDMSLE